MTVKKTAFKYIDFHGDTKGDLGHTVYYRHKCYNGSLFFISSLLNK